MTKKILLAGAAVTTLTLCMPLNAQAQFTTLFTGNNGENNGENNVTIISSEPTITTTSTNGNVTTITRTTPQVCAGRQSRVNFCLDHKGNVIDDISEHWRCDENGDRPSTLLEGCEYDCTVVTNSTIRSGDGDGGGDGDGDGDGNGESGSGSGDPLVFDLDGNGVSLINVDECTMFDIDNDGEANMTGWVDPNDGLLVFDDNGNGIVDDQSELFGNRNNAAYADLAQYDENEDGKINEEDMIWDSLQLWVDANSNGQTDEGELKTVRQMGLEDISVEYETANEIREGNAVTQTGTFTRLVEDAKGKIKKVVAEVIETFFDFF